MKPRALPPHALVCPKPEPPGELRQGWKDHVVPPDLASDPLQERPALVAVRRVVAVRALWLVEPCERPEQRGQLEEIGVGAVAKRRLGHRQDALEEGAFPRVTARRRVEDERRWIGQGELAEVAFGEGPGGAEDAGRVPSLVDDVQPPVHLGRLRARAPKGGGGIRHRVWIEVVVSVEEDDEVTRAAGEARVEGRALAAVLLEDRDDLAAVALDDPARPVSGAVVDDDQLEVVVGLRERAVDRLPDEALHVVGVDDNARPHGYPARGAGRAQSRPFLRLARGEPQRMMKPPQNLRTTLGETVNLSVAE